MIRSTSPVRPDRRQSCGCPTPRPQAARPGFSRRQLFARAGLLGAAAAASPLLQTHYACAADPTTPATPWSSCRSVAGWTASRVVVPHGDPAYHDLRPTIAAELRPAPLRAPSTPMFGLHPAMAPLQTFWTRRVVRRRSTPVACRARTVRTSRRTAEMERAAPAWPLRTGWLDRVHRRPRPDLLVVPGDGGRRRRCPPTACSGPTPELALYSLDSFRLDGADSPPRGSWATALRSMHGQAAPALRAPRTTTLDAIDTVAGLGSAPATTFPPTARRTTTRADLAHALRDVARLIKAKVGLQIACIDFGDWDMHVGPRPE